jgi:Domain of unknown function (DUF1905)/Bacteriocin-protection, YdeI or OmpD-Associated
VLVNNTYLLEKFPGKGGWTFARIPELNQNKNNPFGWLRVKGFIDNFEIKAYHLMPMGEGKLFLPINAKIRKAISKKEGDMVDVVLYLDETPTETPEELLECLKQEPTAFSKFLSLTDGKKKEIIEHIYAAKTDKTKIDRITQTINNLCK